ncbi:MAG: T9SS type A sorting domain-containing protein [Candidatus Marinimicrobia bacterium]|nr:T9SS type A sorting domain-containing protein [Candidatus Neomarinimicrobiota bacterium]
MNKIIRILFKMFIISTICYVGYAKIDINNIKKEIQKEDLNWRAAENWVAELSEKERQDLIGPPIDYQQLAKISKGRRIDLPKVADLPSSFDWREESYVTPVKNQRSCGSCWAFSTVAQMESWWLIENQRPDTSGSFNLSEQFLIAEGSAGSCGQGGSIAKSLDIADSIGIPPEWCLEYKASDTIKLEDADPNWEDYVYKIPAWGYITREEAVVKTIKNALMYHPVSASYDVYHSFYLYDGGVYEPPAADSIDGAHAILIVGWNDADSSWICKNSWGKYWPDSVDSNYNDDLDGYFKIKWGACNIGKYMPFIWNNAAPNGNLRVFQDSINLELEKGKSKIHTFDLQNPSQDTIHFAAMDYSVPVYFHPNTFNAYQGNSWWCGDPEIKGYTNHVLQFLQIGPLDIDNISAPVLDFKAFWSIEAPTSSGIWDGWDGWHVRASTDGGKNYEVIEPQSPAYDCQSLWSFGSEAEGWNMGRDIPGWAGKSKDWQSIKFNLYDSKSRNLMIQFAFASDMALSSEDNPELTGLFIDNIEVYDSTMNQDTVFSNYGTEDDKIESIGYGEQIAEWMTIENSPGTLMPKENYELQIKFNTRNVSEGQYEGKIRIETNQQGQGGFIVPVSLTVVKPEKIVPANGQQPDSFTLIGNYPNPFNASTTIEYYIPEAETIDLTIYNLQGQIVFRTTRQHNSKGYKTIQWQGRSQDNKKLSTGVYFYRVSYGKNTKTGKMLLIK